jgi:hypothetical protein
MARFSIAEASRIRRTPIRGVLPLVGPRAISNQLFRRPSMSVESATLEHAQFLAPRLCQSDSREAMLAGLTNERAITFSMELSFVSRTAMIGGEPVAIWGAGALSLNPHVGCVWAIAGSRVGSVARELLTISRDFISEMHRLFPRLVASIDRENRDARRWYGWLGFDETNDISFNDEIFIAVRREA